MPPSGQSPARFHLLRHFIHSPEVYPLGVALTAAFGVAGYYTYQTVCHSTEKGIDFKLDHTDRWKEQAKK